MAQPSYAIEYLAAFEVDAGVQYTSASILALYPTATVIKLKPISIDEYKNKGVKVGINGGVMFPVIYDDESYLASGKTYIFEKSCIAAIGKYKAIT